MRLYKFIGEDYWSDKPYTDFKKHFKDKIAPNEMRKQFDLIKKSKKSTK